MPSKTKALKSLTYSEKLRHPEWQKMRLRIMERDQFTCRECGDKEKTLNVHHRWYEKGKLPWEYDEMAFVTLCEGCHEQVTHRVQAIAVISGVLTLHQMTQIELLIRYIYHPSSLEINGTKAYPNAHFAFSALPRLIKCLHDDAPEGDQEALESRISEVCRELHYAAAEYQKSHHEEIE